MIDYVLKGIRFFVMSAVAVIFVEVIYEVFSRYVLLQAVPWGAEVSQTLLVWMTFIGSAGAFHKGQHMAIDYLVKSIPLDNIRNTVIHITNACMAGILTFGLISGCDIVITLWGDTTTALQISGGIIYLAFPISMGLMLLMLIAQYITTITAMRNNQKENVL